MPRKMPKRPMVRLDLAVYEELRAIQEQHRVRIPIQYLANAALVRGLQSLAESIAFPEESSDRGAHE